MKIVVVGGTGLIGRQLVTRLLRDGHAVSVAAREFGIDAVSGVGLDSAFAGADAVVDVTNVDAAQRSSAKEFFVAASRKLLEAEDRAGVKHHVVLSIVGADAARSTGYFAAKAAQELVVSEGAVPFTIVRATQFYEFAHQVANWNTVADTVHLPPRVVRPIASTDASERLSKVLTQEPINGVTEVAGPDLLRLDDFVRRVLRKDHDNRYVVCNPAAEPVGFNLPSEAVLPGRDAVISETSLEAWLSHKHLNVSLI